MAGRELISAERELPVAPADVFAFLADLGNHWALAGPLVEVLRLERSADGRAVGGVIRVRGPLGIHKTFATNLEQLAPPRLVAGRAESGKRTKAAVRWQIEPSARGARVRLSAEVLAASPLDALLLLLGGRPFLRFFFSRVLATLERQLAAEPAAVEALDVGQEVVD